MFSGPTRDWYGSLLEGQAEPSDADRDVFKVFHLRFNRLARPEVVLPRIIRTDFRDPNTGSELSCFFHALFDSTENGGYAYFYVQKRGIDQVSHLPWGDSSASPLPGYVTNVARSLSLGSIRSEDSGYASGDVSPVSESLATISEDDTQEQSRLGYFAEGRPTVTDHIVAVSLCDLSLWAIFDAWHENWKEAEEGDDVDWVGLERYETPLKPLRSSTWGKLPGLDGRVQMAKLANNVYTHIFAPNEQITWTIAREGWSSNEIPVLFPALKALDGPVTSLPHTSPTKEITKSSS